MHQAEGFREAKPCQRQRCYQYQDRQHDTTDGPHGDADRPVGKAQPQHSDQGHLEKAQSLKGLDATPSPRVQTVH
jgi:hypothetical protein